MTIKNVYDAKEASRREKLSVYEQRGIEVKKAEAELQARRRKRRRRKPFHRI